MWPNSRLALRSLLSVLLSRSKPRFEEVGGPSLVDPRSAKKQGPTAYDARERAMRIGRIVSVVRGTNFVLMAHSYSYYTKGKSHWPSAAVIPTERASTKESSIPTVSSIAADSRTRTGDESLPFLTVFLNCETCSGSCLLLDYYPCSDAPCLSLTGFSDYPLLTLGLEKEDHLPDDSPIFFHFHELLESIQEDDSQIGE